MHDTSSRPDHRPNPSGHQSEQEQSEQPTSGPLSRSDPEPPRTTGRPPIWLIIIAMLLLAAVIVLHVTGAVGPGSH